MTLSKSARSLVAVVVSFILTYFILFAVIGSVMGQNVTVEGNEVKITIRVQVDGAISGADTVYVTHPADTVYITLTDTVIVPQIEYVERIDTVYVIHPADTVYITEYRYIAADTVYVTQYDTTYITETIYETEYIDRTDTLYVTQLDTVYTTVYDTLYYPSFPVVDIGFSDTPPEWRRVDRIILRPVGWAAGRVKIKGSDDPWWTDIAIEVSTGDIWGTGDYFMYVNIPTTDWTYAAAMLDSLQVQDRRARTGLQIRQSYEPGSPFVFLAYQDGRAAVNMRSEWGGEVTGHPGGSFPVELPVVLQVNMTDQGFDARIHDVWTDSVLHTWSLPNYFEGKFYTGIATTSWRTDYITRAYYSMLNILDAVPWNETCRDGDGNLIDCD